MAVIASDRLTLATLPSPSYVRTYYLKQSSTLNPPGVPKTNPPGGNWSTTEPTFSPNETATVYTVMLTAYGSVSFEYGPVQKSSSFEAAKQAYNQAISAGNSADDAYQKALDAQTDLANLQIGGRNLMRDSRSQNLDLSDQPAATIRTPGRIEVVQDTGWNAYADWLPLLPADVAVSPGDVFTLSVEVKAYTTTRFALRVDIRQPLVSSPYTHFGDTNGEWVKVATSITIPEDVTLERGLFSFRQYSGVGEGEAGAWIEYRNWKLERGTKATDWTPAPEDVDAGITDAQSVADKAWDSLYIHDTREINEPPSWYNDNYARTSVTEFKRASVVGLPSSVGIFVHVKTTVKWVDDSGGDVIQEAVANDGRTFTRHGAGEFWYDWRDRASEALSELQNKPDKSYVDDQIILSANGKNKITTSLNAPSGTGINGDLWRRHDPSGHVYQEFTWRDGGWKPTMVTSEMVTNMDIHKLTVSGDATFATLVADEIWSKVVKARLVVATELIAGDVIVKDSLTADRLKAKTITAESGVIDDLAIKEAHIGNASVTNAKIKDINAEKITSGHIDSARIDARTISTEKLLLGSFDNFFHDPRFEDERGYSPGVVVGETLRLNAGQTVNASWLAMPVDKDESYTVRFRKTGSGNLTFAIHSATTPSGPYSLVEDSFNTYTEAGDFGFIVTADKPYIRWVASNTTAQSFISDIKIQKVFTGIRLEDGIITTEKIQSDAVVADSISADSITSEHMGANSVTAHSIGADQITGDHIGAGTITGEHIEAESVTAANIEAESITTDKLHAGAVTYEKIELGAVRGDHLGDITKDQFMSAVDDDLSNIIDSAETIADSVLISPGEIRLTTEVKSSGTTANETALSLTSTRQTFIVDGKDVVYIDSEEESMNIRNVVVDDSIKVGNHIIEKISDDITAFMWAGDRQ